MAMTSLVRRPPLRKLFSGPTSVTWLPLKSQNGAAMSFGRTSTFLDIYIERDLQAGKITEQDAQEMVDHLVMKLRMVRFLRTRNTMNCSPATRFGQPNPSVVWALTAVLWYQKQLPLPEHPVHHGPSPEPNMTILWSEKLPLKLQEIRR